MNQGAGDLEFPAVVEDDLDDPYVHAPCGFISTLADGTIAKVNATLLTWLGYANSDLVGRRRFADLLAVGSRLYHETRRAWSRGRSPCVRVTR